jgi:hypothetical protein
MARPLQLVWCAGQEPCAHWTIQSLACDQRPDLSMMKSEKIMLCKKCQNYRREIQAQGSQPFSFETAGEPGYMQPSADVVDRHLSDGCEPVLGEGEWLTACELIQPEVTPDAHGVFPILCKWEDGSESVVSLPGRMAIPIEDLPLRNQRGCGLCEADAEWISVPLTDLGPSTEELKLEFYCSECMPDCWGAEDRREAS